MGTGLLSPGEIATYMEAVDWLLELVGSREVAEAWSSPSALDRYSTGGVAAHAVHAGLLRLEALLGEPAPTERRRVGVPEFFGPNKVADPTDDDPLFTFLRASAEDLAAAGPVVLLQTARRARNALAELLPELVADRAVALARVPDGQVPLAAYLGTRVLELIVHGDDLTASIAGWGAPAPPAPAVGVCLRLCFELALAQAGDMGALRAFTRAERAEPDLLRVL